MSRGSRLLGMTLLFWGILLMVSPSRAAPVKFSEALHDKFHHARCVECHQFNSRRSQGRAYHTHRSRYLCEQCHKPELTNLSPGEWMAPPGEKMDYTGMSAKDTCAMAIRNAGSGDKAAILKHHLLHDQRVLWAIRSGVTPEGPREKVPGGYEAWERDVLRWIEGGMVCD